MVDLFGYNPLAPDFLNGVEDTDTPAGYVDEWADIAWGFLLQSRELRRGIDRLFFSTDFIIRALWASMASAGQNTFNCTLIDIDGRRMSNTRTKGFLLFGLASFPKPLLHDWYIPLGRYISIDVENEGVGTTEFQLHFVGVRRTKAAS